MEWVDRLVTVTGWSAEPGELDWSDTERTLGTPLPADFKELRRRFPDWGAFSNMFWCWRGSRVLRIQCRGDDRDALLPDVLSRRASSEPAPDVTARPRTMTWDFYPSGNQKARADDGIRSRNLLLGGAAWWFPLGQGGRFHSRTGSVFGTSRAQCGLYCRGPSASIIVGCPVCRAIASKSRSQCSRVRPDSSATAATRRSTGPALRCSP